MMFTLTETALAGDSYRYGGKLTAAFLWRKAKAINTSPLRATKPFASLLAKATTPTEKKGANPRPFFFALVCHHLASKNCKGWVAPASHTNSNINKVFYDSYSCMLLHGNSIALRLCECVCTRLCRTRRVYRRGLRSRRRRYT